MYVLIKQSSIDNGVFVVFFSSYEKAVLARKEFQDKCREFCSEVLTAAIFKMDNNCHVPEVGA